MGRVIILSRATRSNMLMVSKIFPLAHETTTVGREAVTSRRSTPQRRELLSGASNGIMGPTTNPLDTTERREDLRTDEKKTRSWHGYVHVQSRSLLILLHMPMFVYHRPAVMLPVTQTEAHHHHAQSMSLHTLRDSRHSKVGSSMSMT